jgi:Tfp pilus assembly protein PilO
MKMLIGRLSPFKVRVGLALLVMLGLQVLFEFQLFAPKAAEVRGLGDDIQTLQGRSAEQLKLVSQPQARLQEVLTRLQMQPSNQVRIERMHRIADQNSVLLSKVGYQSKLQSGELIRHEVQADMSGNYPNIRQFLRTLLAQDEALVLEAIEFSRPSGNPGVRAQVRLVFFSWR